jgi:aspartyl aminopeptidase
MILVVASRRSLKACQLLNRSIMTTTTTTRPTSSHLELATKACEFLTASTDPFHAVQTAASLLSAGGFVELNPKAPLKPQMESASTSKGNKKFYYKVHHSTLVAFCVGDNYRPGLGGFQVIGGHTDSPNLRVKPRSRRPAKGGTVQLGVECYGGGARSSKDLRVSSRVLRWVLTRRVLTRALLSIMDRAVAHVVRPRPEPFGQGFGPRQRRRDG